MYPDRETIPEPVEAPETKRPHYYGNLIRKYLFLAGFIIMIATLFDAELRSFYLFIGLFGVVGITLLAGLTSPQKRGIMFTDVFVSAIMFLVFEYFAIVAYIRYEDLFDKVFLLRQTLAVIFLVSLYYSTKTMRFLESTK